jgi:hypothetical protein
MPIPTPLPPTPPSDALIEDLARGLHADWYRATVNGQADDAEVNAFWNDPHPTPSFPESDLMRRSFRNKARALLSA